MSCAPLTRFRSTLALLLVASAAVACGREEPELGPVVTDTVEVADGAAPPASVPDSVVVAVPSPDSGELTEEARANQGGASSATEDLAQSDSSAGPADVSGSAGVAPPAAGGQTTVAIDPELTRLLLNVAAGQLALERRLDSLGSQVRRSSMPQSPDVAAQSGRIVEAAGDTALGLAFRILWSIIVLVVVRLAIGAIVWVLEALAERYPRTRLLWKRSVPIVRILAWASAVFFIVRVIFEVDAQGMLAAAAAVGVAVGFAAQDLLKNLFGGLILVFDQPFQVGDKVEVGGTYGEVVSIGIRSTRIVTPDDSLVSVPNAQVVDGQVSNANSGELNCQVVTDLYLPGTVDEARAKKIAFEAATSSKYVYLSKPIVVLVKDEFKETFLTHLRVKAYVLDPRYEFLFQSDVTERARAAFREAGLMTPAHGMRAYLDLSRTEMPPEVNGDSEHGRGSGRADDGSLDAQDPAENGTDEAGESEPAGEDEPAAENEPPGEDEPSGEDEPPDGVGPVEDRPSGRDGEDDRG